MKEAKRQLLAKVAYLYYIEELSQDQIAKQLGVYRTTISRMLLEAKKEGILKITIESFDPKIIQLENVFKEKYHLTHLSVVPTVKTDTEAIKEERLAIAMAQWMRKTIQDNQTIGIAWHKTVEKSLTYINPKTLAKTTFTPLIGLDASYRLNHLLHDISRKFRARSFFINTPVICETQQLADDVKHTHYFKELQKYWMHLDVAIVAIHSCHDKKEQWHDLITTEDAEDLTLREAIGDCCCRFFDRDGKILKGSLDKKVIAIEMAQLKEIPQVVAVERGKSKIRVLRTLLKKGYIHTLITDQETLVDILNLDRISL